MGDTVERVLRPDILADFVRRVFQAAGATTEGARLVADSLVTSELVGHPSHGLVRVRQYLDSIEAGELDPATAPIIAKETAVITTVDAQNGFGQIAAHFAMQVTIEKAQAQGLAVTGLFNNNHVGRLGEWVQLAANRGLIGLAFCDTGRARGRAAPYGGAAHLLGTNPLAAAVPVGGRPALVLDYATTQVAEGKVRVARNQGRQVPEGWIIDANGQPTTNPEDLYTGGMLLPMAGHKGYGLSLLIELLGGVLTGQGGIPGQPGLTISGNSVLFLVVSVDAFRPLADFLVDGATLCDQVKAIPPAPGFDEVLLPGEPEYRSAERRRASGIVVDETTWSHFVEIADGFGLALPDQVSRYTEA
jgi:uncharacterized oxidoreductase